MPWLVTAYFAIAPDPAVAAQRVAFGTPGHRGSSFDATFNEAHILAVNQAVCQYRKQAGANGPLFIGIHTHALSRPALATALEVFAANGVGAFIDEHDGGLGWADTDGPVLVLCHGAAGRHDGAV